MKNTRKKQPSAEMSASWPHLRIYRVGAYAYAFNPCHRQWETYSTYRGELADVIGTFLTKDGAHMFAASCNSGTVAQAQRVSDTEAQKRAAAWQAVRDAAPDLFTACEQAEHWLAEEARNPGQAKPDMILTVLRDAIAKAKGGAS